MICWICKKEFESYHNIAKYCSKECSKTAQDNVMKKYLSSEWARNRKLTAQKKYYNKMKTLETFKEKMKASRKKYNQTPRWKEYNRVKALAFYNKHKDDESFIILIRERNKKYNLKYPEQRLKNYKKYMNFKRAIMQLPWAATEQDWQNILKQYDYRCAHCWTTENITQDHKIPISRKGLHTIENLQPLCRKCNSKKGNKISLSH